MHFLDSRTPADVSQKFLLVRTHTMSPYRLAMLLLLLVAFRVPYSHAQTCLPTVGCTPKPRLLLNASFPSRTVDASTTCGVNGQSTQYCTQSFVSCDSRNAYVCNGSSIPHTANLMYDVKRDPVSGTDLPDYTTYWQSLNTITSANTADPQYVTINLTDVFLIRKIAVAFMSPYSAPGDLVDTRPNAMAFQGQKSSSDDWTTWRYYASDCARFYPNVVRQPTGNNVPTYDALTPVCMEKYYAGDFATFTSDKTGLQGVIFSPVADYEAEFLSSFTVQSRFMVSALRIRLDFPARIEPLLSYYAIANLEIEGSCACYGHSTDCTGKNEAECNCLHNTNGAHCENCQPLYNDVLWSIGTLNNQTNCQLCSCNEFAQSCHYDASRGRGTCDNCTQYTTGLNCEFCVDSFYINPNRSQIMPTSQLCYGFIGTGNVTYNCNGPCIPCGCNAIGTSPLSLYSCYNTTGQCTCKSNVGGRVCDECLVGYWNLASTNDFGCQACDCNWYGTVNNLNTCDKINGSCYCKANVVPGRCDSCQVGYFNLNADNVDGCSPCDCDLGASLNQICPATSGACSCKSFTGGRTCRDPYPGYFGPSLDYLTFEAEFADNATSFDVRQRPGHGDPDANNTGIGYLTIVSPFTVSFDISIKKTFLHNIILRFENTMATFPGVKVTLQLLNPELEASDVFQCSGVNYTTRVPQEFSVDIPRFGTNGFVSVGKACLLSSPTARYQLTIQVSSVKDSIAVNPYFLLDSVVLIPVLDQIGAFQIANSTMKDLMNRCYSLAQNVSNSQRADNNCPSVDYSLMTDVYEGAVACECNFIGSLNSVCNPIGGQCYCKPNIIMHDCSQCKVDSYGFSNGFGCTLCNCNVLGSIQTSCNESGICSCKANIQADRCDQCIDEYYGLFTGNGCVPCVCNSTYAVSNLCSDDGQCPCKPGVGGIQCDRCANHYFNLTLDGCTSCGCNDDGSQVALACDNSTGSCYCKKNTIGLQCDTCLSGFYGLGPWGNEGCIACYCSGRSSNCTSAPDWHAANISSTWNLLIDSTATQEKWTGVDEKWRRFDLPNPTLITTGEASHVMRIVNDDTNSQSQMLYFLAIDGYLGNKRGAYGQNLNFSLSVKFPVGAVRDGLYINSTDGDVIIQGTSSSYALLYQLPYLPSSSRTNYTVKLHEDNWFVNSTTGPRATYSQMQRVLGSVGSIRIRAKYFNINGLITDFYSASLDYAIYDPFSIAPLVNNVEMCTCPIGYVGQFCELCAPGYTRVTPGSGLFTECVRCFCNNHDVINTNCDPETGSCVCAHNTTGRQCEACLDGFYGFAASGRPGSCQPCFCPGKVASMDANVFAKTCSFSSDDPMGHQCNNCSTGFIGAHCEMCADQWYGTPQDSTNSGGRCNPCTCHGWAQTCNSTTGVCVNCTNNTTGRSCDECSDGFYGNPLIQQCKACSCNGIGFAGGCDSLTGQCKCQPYVTGFNCDRCQLFAYTRNFTTDGCRPCNCSVSGSYGDPPGCNPMTGQCDCKPYVTGLQCDSCLDTFWNVDSNGCEACDCSPIGTANVIGQTYGTCDVITGQCGCVDPSISGRRCDVCARATKLNFTFIYGLVIGTYPSCKLCGDCYDSIGQLVDTVAINMENSFLQLTTLWSNSYNNITNETLMSSLTSVKLSMTSLSSALALVIGRQQEVNQLNEIRNNISQDYNECNDRTNSAMQTEMEIMTKLEAVRIFLTTDITFKGITIPKSDIVQALFDDTKGRQDGIFSSATFIYSTVRRNFNILVNGSGLVDIMKDQVKVALQVLDGARQMRRVADSMFAQTQVVDSSPRLDAMLSTMMNLQGLYNIGSGLWVTMNSTLFQSLDYIMQTEVLNGWTSNETFAILTAYQYLRSAAGQASNLAQTMKFNSERFYNLSVSAKQSMTRSVEQLAGALQNLNAMNIAVYGITVTSAAIGQMQAAPLATVEDISRRISETQVFPDQVSRVNASAYQDLLVVNDVLRLTTAAQNSSDTCLQTLNRVRSQIMNASQLTYQADSIRQTGNDLLSNINYVINSVSSKAVGAIGLADSTDAMLSSISLTLPSLQRQYSLLPDRISSASLSAQQTRQRADNTSSGFMSNMGALDDLQSQVLFKSDAISQSKNSMLATLTEFMTFQSELASLAQTIRAMNTEIMSQLEDLKGLSHDFTYLENRLVLMTITLDQLSVSSVNCVS